MATESKGSYAHVPKEVIDMTSEAESDGAFVKPVVRDRRVVAIAVRVHRIQRILASRLTTAGFQRQSVRLIDGRWYWMVWREPRRT